MQVALRPKGFERLSTERMTDNLRGQVRVLGFHDAPFFHVLPVGFPVRPRFREASHDDGVFAIVTDGTTVAVFLLGLFRWLTRCATQDPHGPLLNWSELHRQRLKSGWANFEG